MIQGKTTRFWVQSGNGHRRWRGQDIHEAEGERSVWNQAGKDRKGGEWSDSAGGTHFLRSTALQPRNPNFLTHSFPPVLHPVRPASLCSGLASRAAFLPRAFVVHRQDRLTRRDCRVLYTHIVVPLLSRWSLPSWAVRRGCGCWFFLNPGFALSRSCSRLWRSV